MAHIFYMKPNKIKKKYDWFTIVRNPYTRILNRDVTAPLGGHYSEQFKYVEYVYDVKIHIIKFESFGHNKINIS